MFWQIKLIHVKEENKDDNQKFNNMIKAIRKNVDVPGYSKIIWIVSKLFWLENMSQVFQDEKKQQWKKETSVHWFLKHRISTNEIQLRMNEGGKEIINANIKVEKQNYFLELSNYFTARKFEWRTPGCVLYESRKGDMVCFGVSLST